MALIIYAEHFFSLFFLQSIIFIRDHNTAGQEVSGYIDYAHRLKTCDFDQIFSGKKKLMPGHSDLWQVSFPCTMSLLFRGAQL